MKTMLKADFFALVNSLLARGIKPELKIALHNNWGNLIWEENSSKMVEPLFSSVSTRQSAIRFQSWFSDIMAAHEAVQETEAEPRHDRKTVTVKGITWTILSANERACVTCPGRFFFASRCNSKSPWYLREHDCDITTSDTGAFEIGYLPYRLETSHLSLAVLDIASRGEVLPSQRVTDRAPLAALVKEPTAEYLQRIGALSVYLKIPGRHGAEYPTAADARDAYKRLRDESSEGASTWPDGLIISGKTMIHLSYNGRAWADKAHTKPVEL